MNTWTPPAPPRILSIPHTLVVCIAQWTTVVDELDCDSGETVNRLIQATVLCPESNDVMTPAALLPPSLTQQVIHHILLVINSTPI